MNMKLIEFSGHWEGHLGKSFVTWRKYGQHRTGLKYGLYRWLSEKRSGPVIEWNTVSTGEAGVGRWKKNYEGLRISPSKWTHLGSRNWSMAECYAIRSVLSGLWRKNPVEKRPEDNRRSRKGLELKKKKIFVLSSARFDLTSVFCEGLHNRICL